MSSSSKQRLLEQGVALLLRQGYSGLGLAALLDSTRLPKGSFYHHFTSKEDFGLQVVDLYMQEVHAGLAHCLDNEDMPPLDRVRHFFELSAEKYRTQGNLGCLLGGLGQELSGISEVFRQRVEECFRSIEVRIAACLALAVERRELSDTPNPRALAELLVNCWEGAALRSRLRSDPAPLQEMLDFYFRLVAPRDRPRPTRKPGLAVLSPRRRKPSPSAGAARLTTRGAKR